MARLPVRPVIVVQASSASLARDETLRISARLFGRDMRPVTVSRIYMQIVSETDGHVVWPLEVIRRDASGFDIEIGTGEMRRGHAYLVRVSNNWNLSPSAAARFSILDAAVPAALVALPLFLSPFFVRRYARYGIDDVRGLVAHLRARGMSDADIGRVIQRISRDMGTPEQYRMPIDTAREIMYKVFVTQTDRRVCDRCAARAADGTAGMPPGHYLPDDPKMPVIPVHPRCRCTFNVAYADPQKKQRELEGAARAALAAQYGPLLQALSNAF